MPPPKFINAVAVDLDGTVVHFTLNYASIRRDILRLLTARGLDPRGYSMRDRISFMLEKARNELASGDREIEIAALERDAKEIIDGYEVENARAAQLVPGARKALAALRRLGLKLGLFTASGKNAVDMILEAHGLRSLFQAIVTRDDVGFSLVKPRTDHLLVLINHLSEKPETTLVIGDSTIDIIPAVQLGAPAVGVEGGIASAQELRQEGAIDVIRSLSQLPRWIEENILPRHDH
ncbi:MAG: HAD family hydrolase [Aigarchaeota archaeon]|nr:HAD family hydrolase [Aigarchaeota archaeon]